MKRKPKDKLSLDSLIKALYNKGLIDNQGRYIKKIFPSLWKNDIYTGPVLDLSFLKNN
jgi:hypothetical protein